MDRQVVEVSSLSLSLSVSFSDYLPTYPPIYLCIHLSLSLSVYLSIYLAIYLSLSLCLSIYRQACKRSYSARLPQFLKLDNIKNAAIQRDFLNHSQFFPLTTSKPKQFCETSYFFKLPTSKTRRPSKNGKLHATLTASYQCVLRFFQSICLNYCAYHEKVMPGHTKCCTCHAKSSQQTWKSEAPKCNPSQEISAQTS